MLRGAAFALLVTSLLAGSLEAQRTGGAFQAHTAGLSVHSGFVGQRGFSDGFFSQRGFPNGFFPRRGFFPNRFHFRHDGFGGFLVPYYFPDYGPFWYDQAYAEATGGPTPPVVIQQRGEGQPRTTETPPAKPLVIDVPGVASSTAVPKTLPPTIFILTNGERLETRRFVLTASALSVSVDRHERTIPVDMLAIDATIAANRERGIDLRVPADRTEIFLSF